MKKEAKKQSGRPAVVKTLTKTIKKPQTVDVADIKVVSVTLTDKGALTIKYLAK